MTREELIEAARAARNSWCDAGEKDERTAAEMMADWAAPLLAQARREATDPDAGSNPVPGFSPFSADAGKLRKRAEELLDRHHADPGTLRLFREYVLDAMLAFAAEREAAQRQVDGSLFCAIMVECIRALSDAAIVGEGPFDGRHALAWVQKLAKDLAAARVRGAEEALLLARQRLRDAAKYDSVRILDEQLADLRQPAAPANERIEWRTGSEWEDVDGADGSKPIVPEPLRQPRPAQEADDLVWRLRQAGGSQ